jgi:hypothetical protein
MTSHINICRPGYGASCSLCCGSHNYRAYRKEIKSLFLRRGAMIKDFNREYILRKMAASRSNLTGSYYSEHEGAPFIMSLPALFDDCPQCPFVGYEYEGRMVGCLLGPRDCIAGLRHECFLSYRGKIFSCRARELLDDEIRYAARLTGDWCYYGILIHEPDLLRGFMQHHPAAEEGPRRVTGTRGEGVGGTNPGPPRITCDPLVFLLEQRGFSLF